MGWWSSFRDRVLEFTPEKIRIRGRLQPGKMFLVDMLEHRIVPDREIKAKIARQQPYRKWVQDHQIELRGMFAPTHIPLEDSQELQRKQLVFGYTEEDLKMIIAPMASHVRTNGFYGK